VVSCPAFIHAPAIVNVAKEEGKKLLETFGLFNQSFDVQRKQLVGRKQNMLKFDATAMGIRSSRESNLFGQRVRPE
jgi:hypothetical protein